MSAKRKQPASSRSRIADAAQRAARIQQQARHRIQELRAQSVEHILEHGSLSSDRGRALYEELLALHLAAGMDPTVLIRGGEALGKAQGWINSSGTRSRAAGGDDSYRREFVAQLQARREEQARAAAGSG